MYYGIASRIGGTGDDLAPFAKYRCIGGSPLKDVQKLLASAALFVGNDSGPAHIAAAFGVPVVVIFGGFLQIRVRIGRKSLRHGLDVSLFAGRSIGREFNGLLYRIIRAFVTVGVSRVVIVRPHSLGDSPVGHGQLGIEFGGMLEGARGFIVIERVNEAQPLIKELLCLRSVGGNGMMKVA